MHPAVDPKSKALIMTVGLPGDQAGDILDALELDLSALKPARLILIATAQSMANARRVQARAGLPEEAGRVIQLGTGHDIDEVFRVTNQAIQSLIAAGYAPGQIAINYTSGTKVMGSGAVLSAVSNKISELRYITGLGAVRDADRARRRIIATEPAAVFAYQGLIESAGMMLDLRFQSARRVLEPIPRTYLSPEDQALHNDLSHIARAYDTWDGFHPESFEEEYKGVSFQSELTAPFRLKDEQRTALARLVAESHAQGPGPLVITDLYNNAARRLLIGRLEDAFTRLYRALEMLAQWILARDYGIDTNDVETRRIPPRDRVGFEALRSLEDGMVKIGLRKAFDLLVILGARSGRHFQQDSTMRSLLEKRAGSILAHGYTPADPLLAREFLTHTRDLFAAEIENFEGLSGSLQFPWLMGRLEEQQRAAAEGGGAGAEGKKEG